MIARDQGTFFSITVAGEELRIQRAPKPTDGDGDEIPEDLASDLPA
jgi:hypothetical protein